jgi:hypothetical protein
MEPQYTRANPWIPGQTREESDALVRLWGFEEGELFLVRSDRWVVLGARQKEGGLNPRTSESGERRAALHMIVKGPDTVGEIDVYITHITGGGNRIKAAQAQDFMNWVRDTRGEGPTIVMAGLSDPSGVDEVWSVYEASGFLDVGGDDEFGTCCRESVIGEQPPLKIRTDFLLYDRWKPEAYRIFGHQPGKRADGTLLYASDHNGLMAVFPLTQFDAAAASGQPGD